MKENNFLVTLLIKLLTCKSQFFLYIYIVYYTTLHTDSQRERACAQILKLMYHKSYLSLYTKVQKGPPSCNGDKIGRKCVDYTKVGNQYISNAENNVYLQFFKKKSQYYLIFLKFQLTVYVLGERYLGNFYKVYQQCTAYLLYTEH